MKTDIRYALKEHLSWDQMQHRKQMFFDYMDSCIEAGCTPEQAWNAFYKQNSTGLSKVMCGLWVISVVLVIITSANLLFAVLFLALPLIWIMFQDNKISSEWLIDKHLNGYGRLIGY